MKVIWIVVTSFAALCFDVAFAQTTVNRNVIEVPFALVHDEIVLDVTVNDKGPFAMLLDTGTDPSAIDFPVAGRTGLGRDGSGRGRGEAGTRPYSVRLPRVTVGALVATNIAAVAADLSTMRERFGMPLDGVLGHSLLNGRIVQIDYPKRVVRFYPASPINNSVPNSSTYARMHFRYDDNVLIDGVNVNGRTVTADLDTGSDGAFKFTPSAVTSLGLEQELRDARPATSVGYDGLRSNFEGYVRSVKIGSIAVESPAVVFFGKDPTFANKPWGIIIGNAFLRDYVVTIDYPAKTIVLERP